MQHRSLAILMALVLVVALIPLPAAGQAASGDVWTLPRTPDGQPDWQGVWLSNSATPLERPSALAGRARLSDEEVAALQARADRIFRNGRSAYAAGDAAFSASMTFTDPTSWVTSWTARMPVHRMDQAIYEFACHEGNHSMVDMLAIARLEQRVR